MYSDSYSASRLVKCDLDTDVISWLDRVRRSQSGDRSGFVDLDEVEGKRVAAELDARALAQICSDCIVNVLQARCRTWADIGNNEAPLYRYKGGGYGHSAGSRDADIVAGVLAAHLRTAVQR